GLLRNFVAFLQAEGASHITRELALRWATQPAKDQPATWAGRLGMVRRFAIWHSAIDPRTEIPPVGLLPHRYRRKPPHIYSDEEIERLLRRTQQLPSPKGLRARTYTTLFGLLVVTGMRVNEAKGHGRGPRLQDMRHRFAARTLIRWYRSGLDAERELPKLSTYLGHVHVNDTYWYLEAVPELLQLATDRLIQREVRL